MKRRSMLLSLLSLVGCAAQTALRDDAALSSNEAYVIIYPDFEFDSLAWMGLDIHLELAKIEGRNSESTKRVEWIKSGKPTLISLPPGLYRLSGYRPERIVKRHLIISGLETLFEVEHGQVNYAGKWVLRGRTVESSAYGSLADGGWTTKMSVSLSVEKDSGQMRAIKAAFPKVCSKWPLKLTAIDMKTDPRARVSERKVE
jgi:hypothetical protein